MNTLLSDETHVLKHKIYAICITTNALGLSVTVEVPVSTSTERPTGAGVVVTVTITLTYIIPFVLANNVISYSIEPVGVSTVIPTEGVTLVLLKMRSALSPGTTVPGFVKFRYRSIEKVPGVMNVMADAAPSMMGLGACT